MYAKGDVFGTSGTQVSRSSEVSTDQSILPLLRRREERGEAYMFAAFIVCCLHITLTYPA